ncbi:MAG: hypothetical protein RLY85_1959 [Bacteroidota bacterium]|jgi:uncharacterized protein (DUF2147 family)
MKLFSTMLLTIAVQVLFAQDKQTGDEILGVWLTGSGNGKVEIYKKGNTYQGKIVWLKEPTDPKTGKPKTDLLHPDKAQHSRPLMGLINIWGFSFDGKETWDNGHIYDPKNGKEYKCIITMKDKNTLNVRGYIGITLIGRNDVWTRSKL